MKVLVGCPTSDIFAYCLDEFLLRLNELQFKEYDLVMADNSNGENYAEVIRSKGFPVLKVPYHEDWKVRVVNSRNMLIEYALENGYDYLLSLDQDVIPPRDVIEKLMQSDKDIISGVYYGFFIIDGVKKLRPLLYRYVANGKSHLSLEEVEDSNLIKVDECGAGCLLIKRGVLDKGVRFGLLPDPKTTDDVYFCHKAHEKGFQIYAYTGVKAVHKLKGRIRPYDE